MCFSLLTAILLVVGRCGCGRRRGARLSSLSSYHFGERCGVSYLTLYRAACRGDLKIIKGFGRMMVSESELSRFVASMTEYLPRKRKR